MKHFIGGSAVGFVVAIIGLPRGKGDTSMDYLVSFIAHMFIAALFGLMAWGLMP